MEDEICFIEKAVVDYKTLIIVIMQLVFEMHGMEKTVVLQRIMKK